MTAGGPGQAASSPWEAPHEAVPQRVLYATRIVPHRSLDRKTFRRLIIGLWFLSLIPSTILFLAGAWPVVGFLGLDIVLLWLAFRASYRDARLYEEVRLTPSELGIARVWPGGRRQAWVFEPYWSRVELERRGEHASRLGVVCRGARVTLGQFLAPEEREKLAEELGAALACRRSMAPG